MKEILIAVIALFVAFVLLSVRVIIRKNGIFSSKHISQSKPLRDRGITCATSQDRQARRKKDSQIDVTKL